MGGGKIMKKFFFLLGTCIALGSCSTGGESATSAGGGSVTAVKKESTAATKGESSTAAKGESATAAKGESVITALLPADSSQAPVFLNCRAVSENEITFEFSCEVKVTSLSFEPDIAVASVENGSIVKVTLSENAPPGMPFTADLLAEDVHKNTINVLVPLRTRNNRMPALVVNEVRTEYSSPRVEYIEFKTKTAGNLGAMRVFFAGNSHKPTIYDFSPAEVKKDEYVVLHLRKREEECRDECGSNLAESGGTDSSPDARDFWLSGDEKKINRTGVIYLLDQDDRVLDAVMFSENPDAQWAKDYLDEAAEFLYSNGAWKSKNGNICSPADAVSSKGSTVTRTICRDETVKNTNTAADWYIAATSNSTPGKQNSTNRYIPK